MKKILGLDLGTNSIGWALISQDDEKQKNRIIKIGSRIIPMSEDILGKFDSGITESDTAARTNFRGIRRLRERHLLRRERLHRVLNIMNFLPEHYSKEIDFEKRLGQYLKETEPKIAYRFNEETKAYEFVFQKSFTEMVEDFKVQQPLLVAYGKKIPYDWTIYYLRKKALTQKIEKEELAWLLLNFNQKRGYYQLRGEEVDETPNKLVEFHSLRVTDVIDSGDRKAKDEIWYNVLLENGWIYRRTSKTPLDWVGKTKEFIVTTDLNEDGSVKTDKDGKEKRSFRSPAEGDWTLVKKKTEFDIERSNKTVGTYIYDNLLENPGQKINGSLVRVVERKFYKDELRQILGTQQKHHLELQDKTLYNLCLEELYVNNESHKSSNEHKDFTNLFLNDIIFYQRPLKSKKSLISDCKFESRPLKDKDHKLRKDANGNQVMMPIKCIAKSHPLFQEFRLWQWMKNLAIYDKATDKDVTAQFLETEDDWVNLFEWLNDRKEVDHKAILNYLVLL
ncbi:MAG: type II CRISPR RNA-guided endonuclease Cas9 [Chitinophagaceae bacterium]